MSSVAVLRVHLPLPATYRSLTHTHTANLLCYHHQCSRALDYKHKPVLFPCKKCITHFADAVVVCLVSYLWRMLFFLHSFSFQFNNSHPFYTAKLWINKVYGFYFPFLQEKKRDKRIFGKIFIDIRMMRQTQHSKTTSIEMALLRIHGGDSEKKKQNKTYTKYI